MPSLVRILTHPESRRPGPPPLNVDLRKVVLAGLAAWALALIVAVILVVADVQEWPAIAVCVSGLALGGLGLLWARKQR
ncbi:DUF2530 domain-containing protein [Xylanimonas ulmi]|uniref:Uncharacterized protein DUF2530 n=1 Tax=Xylanimonas ulmi TaxID=228973 RepID=A0A4Q7M4X5_9MICO|nr:DUF2530 domain-containing protein [Xylanibacterium ulmi]RZS62073.1 uncharacterized protein DUF2530 [Xylanibacterium ulmi]